MDKGAPDLLPPLGINRIGYEARPQLSDCLVIVVANCLQEEDGLAWRYAGGDWVYSAFFQQLSSCVESVQLPLQLPELALACKRVSSPTT